MRSLRETEQIFTNGEERERNRKPPRHGPFDTARTKCRPGTATISDGPICNKQIEPLASFRNTLGCMFSGNEISDQTNVDLREVYDLHEKGGKDST